MNIYSVLSFFAFIAYIGLGLFVLFHNKRAKLNWFFFIACLSLAIWSFCYSIHINASTKEMAMLWRRFSAIGWAFMPVSITAFLLVLTNIKSMVLKKYIIPAFYIAALVFLIRALTGNLLITDLYRIGDIWFVKDNKESLWFYAWNVYFIFTYIISLFLIFYLNFRSNLFNLKKASKIFSCSDSGMPAPVSLTKNLISFPTRSYPTSTLPSEVYLTALDTRLANTLLILSPSAWIERFSRDS